LSLSLFGTLSGLTAGEMPRWRQRREERQRFLGLFCPVFWAVGFGLGLAAQSAGWRPPSAPQRQRSVTPRAVLSTLRSGAVPRTHRLSKTDDDVRLVFSRPVAAPPHAATAAGTTSGTSSTAWLAGPDAVYNHTGMPAVRSFRPFSASRLDDGTIVQASIVCFAGDHIPVWSHSDVPSSIVAHRSLDGKTWNYSATIAAARDFPWSGEGFNECATAVASDGKTVVTAIRTGAGDYTPAASCIGYFDYHTSRSSDSGLTWTFPEAIPGAGSCSPNLISLGGSLILGGGRMCGNSTTDIFLWLDKEGMGNPGSFVPYSLSYWYNALQMDPNATRFDSLINSTCRDETSGMISVKALDNSTGSVTFDIHAPKYTMNFSLAPSGGLESEQAHGVLAGGLDGPGSVPLGRDKSNCISVFGAPAEPTNGSVALPPPWPLPLKSTRPDAPRTRGSDGTTAGPAPIPQITRVCYNKTIKATRHAKAHTICPNLTAFPTDGALIPIVIIGSNFSWAAGERDNSAATGGPTCRIDPYHGGSLHVHKGQNSNASDSAINYVTFPAVVVNDTYATCTPPPVLSDGD